MVDIPENYQALTPETLAERLQHVDAIATRVGRDSTAWSIEEVGDGNLNLVFIVSGTDGTVVVKQALPYVRLVGDSWPLPLTRSFFEYHALSRQAQRAPGCVPELFHFDQEQAIVAMEYLHPHAILRGKLIAGDHVAGLAETLGTFCARTAFRGSDLHLDTTIKKADNALFLGNVALCEITEDLVFTDPYFNAELNHHNPALDALVADLRADSALKSEVQHLMMAFTSRAETLCHGDLHTGSVMCTDTDTKVIDPEFAFYGPMGFDLGMLLANLLMAYFSQDAHRSSDNVADYQAWLLDVINATVTEFNQEFSRLWNTERHGILYPECLFEDQNHSSDSALHDQLAVIWEDAIGFAGIEMHRRTLSLAHNADFESIEDATVRAPLEARNLNMGRELILNRRSLASTAELTDMARKHHMSKPL